MTSPEPVETSPSRTGVTVPSRTRQIFALAFVVGLLAGVGTDLGDELSSGIQKTSAKDFLVGAGALGAASAALSIAVLALVAVWFDDAYLEVLQTRGGWVTAMRPFRIIGTVSVFTTLAAMAGIFLLPVGPLWLRAAILAVTGGLLMWSLVGSLVLISLLFEHGRDRAQLVQGIRERRIAEGLPPQGLSTSSKNTCAEEGLANALSRPSVLVRSMRTAPRAPSMWRAFGARCPSRQGRWTVSLYVPSASPKVTVLAGRRGRARRPHAHRSAGDGDRAAHRRVARPARRSGPACQTGPPSRSGRLRPGRDPPHHRHARRLRLPHSDPSFTRRFERRQLPSRSVELIARLSNPSISPEWDELVQMAKAGTLY